ncbi:MAG TPA: hypothetical protein VE861_14340, partial [Gemmatimonadaceae bacterium]|nr:hypothetical protein [Gemmatimonadaceae bacterium]
FDRVGCFTYSPQEGTRAYDLDDDVPEPVKQERKERIEELQRAITSERYERFLGRETRVLVERSHEESGIVVCRAPWQADDIDGVTHIDTDAPAGALVEATITDVIDDYDFEATATGIVLLPPAFAPRARTSRTLPLMASSSIGSFGR